MNTDLKPRALMPASLVPTRAHRCGLRYAAAPSARAGSGQLAPRTERPAWRPVRMSVRGRCTATGRWRDPAGVAPLRSWRKRLTMRSSRLWKVTTASRPPAEATRSAAREPLLQLVELGVQVDADRLEGAGRRDRSSVPGDSRAPCGRPPPARRCGSAAGRRRWRGRPRGRAAPRRIREGPGQSRPRRPG